MALPKYTPGKTTPSNVSGNTGLPEYTPTKSQQKPVEEPVYTKYSSVVDNVEEPKKTTISQGNFEDKAFSDLVPRKDTTSKILRTLLPQSLEKKLGLWETSIAQQMNEAEDTRQSYYRAKRQEQNILNQGLSKEQIENPRAFVKEGYKEPTNIVGMFKEDLNRSFRQTVLGSIGSSVEALRLSPESLKWAENFADKQKAYILKNPELLPDIKTESQSFLGGGYKNPRWYTNTVSSAIASMSAVLASSALGGIVGGPAGATAGAIGSSYTINSGNAYDSYVQNGIAPDKAGPAAMIYGSVASALETVMGFKPQNIATGKGLSPIVANSFKEFLKKELPKYSKKYLIAAIGEGGEEAAQSLSQDIIGKFIDQNKSNKEILLDVVENFVAGMVGSVGLGSATTVVDIYKGQKKEKALNDLVDKTKEMLQEAPPSAVVSFYENAGLDTNEANRVVNIAEAEMREEQASVSQETADGTTQQSVVDVQSIIDEASNVAKQVAQEAQKPIIEEEQAKTVVDIEKIQKMADEALYGLTEPATEQPKQEKPQEIVQKEQKPAKEEDVKLTTEQAQVVENMVKTLDKEGYSPFEIAREIQKKEKLSIDKAIKLVQKYSGQELYQTFDKSLSKEQKESQEKFQTKLPEYAGLHTAPTRDGYNAPGHDLSNIFPDDIYTDPNAYRYYGHSGDAETIAIDKETIQQIRNMKGKPNKEITIYRAVPNDLKITKINPGDWVTTNKNYAIQHGESNLNGEYKILEKNVRVDEIFTDGNSIHEFGYDPREEKNQTKKRTKKGFITSQEALEKAMEIPIFKELQARGQVVLSEKLNNPKALASYYKGIIKFINNPHETTLPHEAFHAFADLVLTTDEKATALDLVREPGMGDLQAEEKLAQDFAEWYVGKQKKSLLEKIFDKIKAFFDKLVGNRNEIEALFESVLDAKLVREINSFEKLGGIEALRAEYNQSPEEFTYELFEKSDIWKKSSLKRATIIGALGSLRKPLMKEFVATKLDTDFAGQDVIDTEELRRSIYSDLLQLKIIKTKTYANYGYGNIGRYFTNDTNYNTYIINTNFIHGTTGHMPGDFTTTTTKDDLEVRIIKAGIHNGQRVEEDQYYVTRKDLSAANLVEGTFGKFNTQKEAQEYIDNFSDRKTEEPGMFGWFRAFTEDGTFNVAEMQSDVFQKFGGQYFRSNKRLMEADLEIVQDDIEKTKKEISDWEQTKQRQETQIDEIKKEIKDLDKNFPEYDTFVEAKQSRIDAFIERVTDAEETIARKQDYVDRQEKELDKIRAKYTDQAEGVFFGKTTKYNRITESIKELQETVDNAFDTRNSGMNLRFVESALRDLNTYGITKRKNLNIRLFAPTDNEQEKVDIDLSDFSANYIQELTRKNTKYGDRNRKLIVEVLESRIAEAKSNLPSKEEFLKLTPQEEREIKLSEQFISFKNNYYETIINSAIRQAAMNDAEVVRFATPYTVANVEGYITNQDNVFDSNVGDYTQEEIENIGVNGEVDVLGYTGYVTSIGDGDYSVVYTDSRDGLSRPYTEDDIIDGERESRESDFNYLHEDDLEEIKDKLREYIENYPNLSVKPLGEELEQQLLKTIDEAQDIEALENVPGFEDVKEEIIQEYMDNFDPYEQMRDIYGNNGFATWDYRGTTYYVDAAGSYVSEETLSYRNFYEGDAESFKLSDIESDEHRVIASKYGVDDDGKEGAFLKYLKRKRKDLTEVVDEHGFSWYESTITPEDKASVELYQTEDQIEGDDAWQEREVDMITGAVKAEDLKPIEKNPVFNTGDKLEDAKRTLLFAENRVGLDKTEKQPVRKVRVTGVTKIPLPQELQQEALYLELKRETIESNPVKQFKKFENKKEKALGEVLGAKAGEKASKWQRMGDKMIDPSDFPDLQDENGNVSSEDVREKYEKWREEEIEFKKDLKEFKAKVLAFRERAKDSLALQKIAEQEEKKMLAELDRNAKAEEKRKRQEDKKAIFEQGLANARAEEFKKQERIRVINQAKFERVKELSKWDKLVGQKLNPLKYVDRVTQNIFKDWNNKILKGSLRADKEAQLFPKIPANQGFDVIQKYEAGKPTEYTAQIKEKFDALLKEARERGVDFGYRENYVPHVYRENSEQIKKAIRKYLADKGLTENMINAYENGEELPEAIVNALKINPFFSKERVFPTYEVAMKYGLTPKYTNVAQLVGHYIEELETIVANNELIEELQSTGKILPDKDAPKVGWEYVELPPSAQGYKANPRTAYVIKSLFGDQETVGFWKIGAYVSKKMQQIKLSAGLPYSTVNFFAIGAGLIKEITAGNFKAVNAFYRANFNRKSMEWFQENIKYVGMMANQGIDLRKTVDSWEALHSTIKDIKARGGKKADIPYVIDEEFDRVFSDKTFMSFMPMLQVQLFKDTYNKFIEKGYPPTIAEEYAGKVIIKNFGITEFNARSQKTKDQLSTIFFAPQFREGVINSLYNTGASGVDFIKNLGGLRGELDPTMVQNRKLLAGMILTFALYNLLNAALNDDGDDENGYEFMWDNPKNRKFALQIPTDDGTLVYVEFMPSFLSFARNVFSGAINLAGGQLKDATQNFSTLFSMPIRTFTDVLITGKDFYGRDIYKETDTGLQQVKKAFAYLGLSVMHPYITEMVNQIEDKKPLYQSIITGLELPLKFSTKEKVAQGEYYDALEKKAKENARAKEKVMPKYEAIQELKDQGKYKQALDEYNKLTDEEKLVYNKIKENPYEKKKQKISIYEDSIESLKTKSLQQVENEIAKTLYGEKPTASQKSTVAKDFAFYREFNDYKYKAKADELKGLNNESKILYMKKMKSEMTQEEYQEFIRKGRKMVRLSSGKLSPILISDEVLKAVR